MNEVVLRYGNTDLNIYDGYDLTKSSQEVTYSDLTCEFTGHSVDELPERYQEAKIIEKQKVNQEVETIQYEEKNKIKEATFDSEINENLLVDKVYGSTSQETREESKSVLTGSEIVVNDTYIDNKTQFIIDGNSKQKTTEGYNLCYSTNISSNNLYFQIDKNTISDKTMTISFITDKDLTYNTIYINITNSDDTKENPIVGYINGNANTRVKLTFTLSDEVYSKVQSAKSIFFYIYKANAGFSTLEQAQINLGNDRIYESYTGGIPSPNLDYPQKIEVIDGVNKFNLNYIEQSTSKVVTDTGVNLIKCWGTQTFNNEKVLKTFKPNTTYTMKAKAKVVSRPSTILSHQYGTMLLYRPGSSSLGSVATPVLQMADKETITLDTEKEYITTFITPADLTDMRLLAYSFYGNDDGSATGVPQGEIDLTEIMLVEGTYTEDNFPEYLSYGNIGLKQTGKNIFDGEFELGIYNGATGAKFPNSNYIRCKNFIPVEELTNYKFSTDSNAFSVVYVYEYKGDFSYNLTSNKSVDLTGYLTTNKDTKYITFRPANSLTDTTIKVQIEEGTIATVYEPYHEPKIIPIDLQGNELSKVDNIKDKLRIYRNGEVEIEKKVGKIVLDGNETWKLYKTYLYTIIDDCALSPTISTKVATLLSDKFTATSLNDISNNANYGIAYNAFGDREQQKGVCFNVNDYFNSVATLKTWLSNNNVEVYYELATPQTITLPSISPIELEQGTNIFKLISNLDTTMELTYNYISAMPSTETPSKINNTESINIKIQNESLFDIKELVKMSSSFSKVENGYTFKAHSDMFRIGVDLEMPISLPISISYNVKNGTGTNFRLKFWFDDGSTQVLTDYKSGTDTKEHAIVINNFTRRGATKITKIGFDWSTVGTFTITNFMINEGTTTKPYIKHKEQNISFNLDKPLYENCYLAKDGIHYNRTQSAVNITSAIKLSNGNVAGVYYPPNKTIKMDNLLICSKAKFGKSFKTNTVYENPANVVFVGEATDTLKTLKQKFDGAILEYELKNEIIVPYTEKQKRSWKNLQKLISYTGKNYVESTTDIDIKCPTKIKKEIIPKIYEKLLFTGYVDDYSFNEMREKDVDIDINITLYSPMKMTTLRTATAVGTYELKSLIQKEILSPLIDDGFSIEELDITNRQLTVNYISETIEYCMNNLSNKFNFWWFIDEQKRIYIKDIDKLMGNEANYIYDDTHSIAGLQYIKPITESDNYANVVNFKNVRIYEYSRLQLNGNTITQEHNPLISQQITTIKNGEQLDFNFPCDIKKENIIKSAESNGITQYFYGIYVKGTYSDNTTFEFSIGYDDINKTFETTDNVGFDRSENATEEFLLIRDSFFSNLITGFKLNNENKSIKSIEKITSDSALIWNVNKLYNDKAIADKREIISKTGIVETTIDMNESWKTIQELREIGVSYMNKNSLDLNGTIELCTDRNVFEVGKTIYINKMLVNGTYIITQIKESVSNNDVDYYITAKNANMLDNYIDVFRGEASQESSDKTYQVYITHYEEENMYERHEVVQ